MYASFLYQILWQNMCQYHSGKQVLTPRGVSPSGQGFLRLERARPGELELEGRASGPRGSGGARRWSQRAGGRARPRTAAPRLREPPHRAAAQDRRERSGA